jgi:WD40 repeat protein
MIGDHFGHTATLLANEKVLVVGGGDTSAELYDPATGTFTATGSMAQARAFLQATLLPNGKVLVTGGGYGTPMRPAPGPTEVYDAGTAAFAATGTMLTKRFEHTASLLSDGKVLVAGGYGVSAELYDPATGNFTATGSMITDHSGHTATLLAGGTVLVVGGGDASAELYDPATGTFTPTGSMAQARALLQATLLPNGKVLVTGGGYGTPMRPVPGPAEVYDAGAVAFTLTGTMLTERFEHMASLLFDGRVLVTGGHDGVSQLKSAELFTP